jgi:hypothetical protein
VRKGKAQGEHDGHGGCKDPKLSGFVTPPLLMYMTPSMSSCDPSSLPRQNV